MSKSNLYRNLQNVKTEEDVKDVYIKALGLKSYNKGLIDIRTDEIWFEAKDKANVSSYKMFTQLLHYVQVALDSGERVPPFLAVIDAEKAAIMKTEDVLPLLKKKDIKWGKSASQYTQEALDKVSAYIGTHFVSFKIKTHEDEFISTVKAAIRSGDIIRTQITPDNLKQVFDKWVEMIGREIKDVAEENYALLFFADVMHDGSVSTHENLPSQLLHKNNAPVFLLEGKVYELGSKEGYRRFWAIYHKPPKEEYRNYLLERRDSLIAMDERSFKGAYYTPLNVVDKAYDKLSETLGRNWQKKYIVWDMCCGVGNLEVKHSNHRNIFMSTLDQDDVDVMRATKTCVSAERFQYDYLNDDITEEGTIDYSLTNKIPLRLREAIAEKKKILVLINPPYAEATNSNNTGVNSETQNRKGISTTNISNMAKEKYGKASNELYTQFVARIAQEIPNATLAMFSTLKYVNAPTLRQFRENWNAEYKGGFIVSSKLFDGLKGTFPIAFLVWKTDQESANRKVIDEVLVEVFDKNVDAVGEKSFLNIDNHKLLTDWVDRVSTNDEDTVPLKNAITPATAKGDLRGKKWADGALAWLNCAGNDLQNASTKTMLFSSGYGSARGFFVTPNNIRESAVVFSVRRLIKKTWINDRDQFLQPTQELSVEFYSDCLIWMLFSGSNLTAGADNLEWDERTWSIVNHFIPYTEDEVNAPERFESNFMIEYLSDKKISSDARDVLDAGRDIWRSYFNDIDPHNIREELKLNRADVGWYQIRNALKARNRDGYSNEIDFEEFETAYSSLTDKLQPLVFKLGFLLD